MPQIETFKANVNAPRADSAGSEAYEIEGRHIESAYAQAGAALGRGISEAGKVVQEHETMVGTADLLQQTADLKTQTMKDLEAAKTTMDPHDPEAVQKFLDAHQDALNKMDPGPGATDQVKQAYERMKADYQVTTTNQFLGYQSQAAANDVINKYTNSATQLSNISHDDPTTYLSNLKTLHDTATALPAEHRETFLSQTAVKLADATADGVVNRVTSNPAATVDDANKAIDYLKDPKNGIVQVAALEPYLDRLAHVKDTQADVQSKINAQALGNVYTQIQGNGGIDVNGQGQSLIDNYKGATPAATQVWKAEQQRKLDDAKAYGAATKGVAQMPSPDVDAELKGLQSRIDNAKPDNIGPLLSQQKAVIQAINERDKWFFGTNADPAGYVVQNSDVVNSRYQDFTKNPAPSTFAAYATASLAEQSRLYPQLAPRILSNDFEQQISGAITKAASSNGGPAALGDAISSYAKQTGAYWPQIAIQLRQDKVIPGTMGVGAELYGDPKTQALGESIIQASQLKPAELKDKYNIAPEKALKGVDAAMKPLIATMGNLPNADQLISDYRDAAVAAVQYSGDPNSATAVVQKMLTSRYDIENKTLRIPKSLGLNAGVVGAGASAVQADLGNHQLVLPPHFGVVGVTANQYTDQIKSTGRWYTNDTNTGALLYDEDGHNVQEMKNGKPVDVELSWDELSKAGNNTISGQFNRVIGGR